MDREGKKTNSICLSHDTTLMCWGQAVQEASFGLLDPSRWDS